MSLSIFEEMRWANADWYTSNPVEHLNDEQLAALAAQAGMTVEELRRHATTPHVEMTCPLCGRPQTHLVNCKGCGSDAWGWEWEEAHGEDAADRVRRRLQQYLTRIAGVSQDQVQHAVKNACAWGGCQVCRDCWRNTLPGDHYLTCPINLAADRELRSGLLPTSLLLALPWEGTQEELQAASQEWVEATWRRWTEHWNTVSEAERPAVAKWRAALLYAALEDAPPSGSEPAGQSMASTTTKSTVRD